MAQGQVLKFDVLPGSQGVTYSADEQKDVDIHCPDPSCGERYARPLRLCPARSSLPDSRMALQPAQAKSPRQLSVGR